MTKGNCVERCERNFVLPVCPDSDLLVKRMLHWINGIQLLLAEL